ncbi:hypothetical protein [Actinoplanes sp. DH11]|uniref:hypothetical protein n=1 Tax=Actinoplanes sp. DH11 TaxID=2857011 RepID=UPI001E4B280E|nr:hypothetical protein [Actinoplanes sp. DH11]
MVVPVERAAGAEELLSVMGDEQAQACAFYLLAELAWISVRWRTGQGMDDLVQGAVGQGVLVAGVHEGAVGDRGVCRVR